MSRRACFFRSRATGLDNRLVFRKVSGFRGERVGSTSARPRLPRSPETRRGNEPTSRPCRLVSAEVPRHRELVDRLDERVGSFATKSRDFVSERAHLSQSREILPEISRSGHKQARGVANKPVRSSLRLPRRPTRSLPAEVSPPSGGEVPYAAGEPASGLPGWMFSWGKSLPPGGSRSGIVEAHLPGEDAARNPARLDIFLEELDVISNGRPASRIGSVASHSPKDCRRRSRC
jgi:hypothetical protein